MAVNWEKFDKAIDLTGLQEDIKDAQENGGTFKEVPHGKYEVKIEKLELVESKSGNPMDTCWMVVLEGEYKGSRIFYNQVVNQGFQIHLANEFIRSLGTNIDVEFESYSQYGQLLMDVHEALDGMLEYGLHYGEGKKGFSTYEITDVYEV